MSNEQKTPVQRTENRENLQARYKPIGLRAVVAATQCKAKRRDARRERQIPPVLRPLYD